MILTLWGICFALGGGPIQSEYLTFEEYGNNNNVNLPTGNMVYNIHLGDVGGPAGVGYPVVLSYHAGILNDQEATWTGLGWGLNVGSINRMIRGFPDDYNSESSLIHTHARGGGVDNFISTSGQYYVRLGFTFHWANWGDDQEFGLWGWQIGASIKGISGYFSGDKHGNFGYHSNAFMGDKGSWGITRQQGENGPEWGGYVNLNFNGIGLTLKSGESPRWSFPVFNMYRAGKSTENMKVKQNGFSIQGFWIGLPGSYSHVTTRYTFDEMTSGNAVGYLYQSPYTPSEVTTENPVLAAVMGDQESPMWNYVLKGETGGTPTIKKRNPLDRLEYAPAGEYTLPSQDIYMVNAQGVGGIFKPISYNSQVTCYSENDEYNGLVGKPKEDPVSGEDPFEYYFNSDQTKVSTRFSDGIVFKMIGESALNLVDNNDGTYVGSNDYANIDAPGGTPDKTFGTRIEPIFGLDEQFKDKLTGFVVTTQGGMNYYYTQPLFSLQNVSLVNNRKEIPEDINLCGQTSHSKCMGNDNCECSYLQDFGAYATSWLLTAVTGPDYIKKVWIDNESEDYYDGESNIPLENMRPHQGDYGYWASFRYEYGAPIKIDEDGIPVLEDDKGILSKITYPWQYPYKDWAEQPCESDAFFTSFGLKEITYLKSIETATEVAYFRTSERLDGIGLDFESEYPRFHNEYLFGEDKTSSDKIVEPVNERCEIKKGCDRTRVCKLPSVIPLSTSFTANTSTVDQCYTITIDDPGYYSEFDYESIEPGCQLASITFASDVVYKSCNRNHDRPDQEATMKIIKDRQGWAIDGQTRKITAKQDQVGSDLVNNITADKLASFTSLLSIANPLLAKYPDQRCKDYCQNESFQTEYARCIYAEKKVDDNGNNVVVLYVVGYDGYYPQAGKDVRTGMKFGQWHFQWKWGGWEPWNYSKPKFVSGRICTDIWDRYKDRNKIVQFLKKLDEIAWYSKSEYPFLNGVNDPGTPLAKQYFPWEELPYPQSYRRVKLRYNYELAKGTPNSINLDDLDNTERTGGRLTLKEVREEGGPENASVSMPPYLFEYEVKDESGNDYEYTGFQNTDAWGYRTPSTGPDPDNSSVGVNWNLKRILLPSCSSIEFEYERDNINSVHGSLYKMSLIDANKCPPEISILPEEETSGQFYIRKNIAGISGTQITLNDATGLLVGMYFFIHIEKSSKFNCNLGSFPNNLYCPGTDNEYKYAKYWFKVAAVSGDVITANSNVDVTDINPAFGSDLVEVIAIKMDDTWCGDIRTKSITYKSVTGEEQKEIFDYSVSSGVVEVLPQEIVPSQFIKPLDEHVPSQCECTMQLPATCGDCSDVNSFGEKRYERKFVWNPFSTDIAENYSTGNTNVMYPVVEKYFVDGSSSPQKIAGTQRHYYHSINDIVNGKPLISVSYPTEGSINTQNVQVKRIVDRSGLVGMPKKLELYDNEDNLVVESEVKYTFSEDLSENTPQPRPGAYYDNLSSRLPGSKPVGLIQERTITRETEDGSDAFPYKSIADIIISRPFMTGVKTKKMGVEKESKIGLFDAKTGNPSVTLTQEIDENGIEKPVASVEIPYYLTLDRNNTDQAQDYSNLVQKNMYNLPGVGFKSIVADFDIPGNIQTVITNHNTGFPDFEIIAANAKKWDKNIASGVFTGLPFDQIRFFEGERYSWKGGNFVFPNSSSTDWLKNSTTKEIDQYSRSLLNEDAEGSYLSLIYHPYLNAPVGKVVNSSNEECAVYTCDYDDDLLVYEKDAAGDIIHMEDYYYDKTNGWIKGLGNNSGLTPVSRLDYSEKHFGNKCVYVENACGPTKNCKISSYKQYKLSAWVKVIEGTIKLVAEYRTGTSINNLNPPTYFNTEACSADPSKWQHIEAIITTNMITGDNWYIRMWVGNDNNPVKAYIDDIRFFPDDALTTTYYYDQNLELPITVVDENNKAKYVKYDSFGKEIERGIINDN